MSWSNVRQPDRRGAAPRTVAACAVAAAVAVPLTSATATSPPATRPVLHQQSPSSTDSTWIVQEVGSTVTNQAADHFSVPADGWTVDSSGTGVNANVTSCPNDNGLLAVAASFTFTQLPNCIVSSPKDAAGSTESQTRTVLWRPVPMFLGRWW